MSTVVALDLGSSAIAGVEVKTSRDRVSLSRAAVEQIPAGLIADGEIQQPAELAAELKAFFKSAKFSGKRVRLGVANHRVLTRTIDLPLLTDDKERRAAIEFEAAEHIPIPANESVLDYQPIARFESESGPRERIVLVAAYREMIDSLTSVVRSAGLTPVGIDLEAFAILRALLPTPLVVDEGSVDSRAVAVCHVGAEVTNVIVSIDGRCHFTRLVGFGGENLTRAVEERTGLPHPEAEELKIACGLLGEIPEGWDADRVSDVRHALALGARPLVREISRSLDFYRGQPHARAIDHMVISGGSAGCAGLDRYLQQGLGMRVENGDPRLHLDGADGLEAGTASRAAVAIGLALDGAGGPR